MTHVVNFVTGNASKLAEMSSSRLLPPVQLKFPERCTPENISLFSGFMATIPHLMAHRAKERYNMDVEVRYMERKHVTEKTRRGFEPCHTFLSSPKQDKPNKSIPTETVELTELLFNSPTYHARLNSRNVANGSPVRKIAGRKPLSSRTSRCRRSTESRMQRKIQYANAISAWDRVKRQKVQKDCGIVQGSISSIIGDVPPPLTCTVPQSEIVGTDYATNSIISQGSKISELSDKEGNSLLFDEWASLDFSDTSLDTFGWLTGEEDDDSCSLPTSSFFNTASSYGASDSSSTVDQLLKDWYS